MKEIEHNRIIKFYEKLDEELLYFELDMLILIESYDFIIYEYYEGKLAGIGGVRNGNEVFLVVRKCFHGKKIGQMILQKTIIKAKKDKYNFLILTVHKTNVIAYHIYKKYNFKKIFVIKVNGKKSFFMFRPLTYKNYLDFFFYLVLIIYKRIICFINPKSKIL